MRCSQALDRLFCSSKAVSAVRFTAERTRANCFTGDRTSANCETPENEEESRTRQGLERRHRRTSKQRHSKENHGNCLEGLLTEMTAVTLDCCCGVFVTIGQATWHKSTGLQRQGIIIWRNDAKHQAANRSLDWLRHYGCEGMDRLRHCACDSRTGYDTTAVRVWTGYGTTAVRVWTGYGTTAVRVWTG